MSSMSNPPTRVTTLIIDNYDSFTYNLYQLVAQQTGSIPAIIYNDAFGRNWKAVRRAYPHLKSVIISPGPGNPEEPGDFGLSRDALLDATLPVLGVCLGHQGLGFFYGGKVWLYQH